MTAAARATAHARNGAVPPPGGANPGGANPGGVTPGGANQNQAEPQPEPSRKYQRFPELVDIILKRAADPWVSLAVRGVEIVNVRLGGCGVLMGPTGGGKSSLAIVSAYATAMCSPFAKCTRRLPR